MILETIQSALSGMPPIYHRIAVYILENHQKVGFSSIYSLSDAIGVSTASIVRFTKALGLDGYADLKKAVQEELKQHLSFHERIDLATIDPLPSDLQVRMLGDNEIANLRKTIDDFEAGMLMRVVGDVHAAARVHTCGFGLSGYIMDMLGFSLSCVCSKEIIAIRGAVIDYAARLNDFKAADMVFLSDFPPYNGEIFHVARHVREKKGKIVLFTDSPRCPAYSLADTVIRCENNSLVLANSYVGLISVLQILVNLLFLTNKEEVSSRVFGIMDVAATGYEIISLGKQTGS